MFLRSKRCEFYQRYLFSKPLTAAQFENLLTETDKSLSLVGANLKVNK